MNHRPIRIRGAEYPVLERFRIGGRTYLAIEKLGSAGRQAFKVFDTSAKTLRVLHVLKNSPGVFERVRLLQRLTRGDNEILQIIECQSQDDRVWVVLPWVDGFNLRSVLTGIRERKKQRIAAPEAVRLAKGVAHALSHLHKRKQIIHGDIKPANLILTKRTSLVLIDYGNAWAIERTTSRSSGDGVSAVYAAPEFLRGESAVDFRADVFSLGVVLYEVLTGKIPYDGHGGKLGLLPSTVQSGSRLVPASEISPERVQVANRIWVKIDRLLARSLAIEASKRFETTSEWLDAWNDALAEIHQAKRKSKQTNLAVRFLDWIESRFK
ncbi:serine/threonine protein kinase [Rhodopirellula bahusiensis]|uniref:serine/threonine protein kinase n=1 Tax=Rhodopirellula bahusiensis TaxID=2014065 RepID=UPI003263672B